MAHYPSKKRRKNSSGGSGERRSFQEYQAEKREQAEAGSSQKVVMIGIGLVAVAGVGYALLEGGGGGGEVLLPGSTPAATKNEFGGGGGLASVNPASPPSAAAPAGTAAPITRYGVRQTPLTVSTNVYGATLTVVPALLAEELAERAAEEEAAAEPEETPESDEPARLWPGEEAGRKQPAERVAEAETDAGEEWPKTFTLGEDDLEHAFEVPYGEELIVTAAFGDVRATAEVRGGDRAKLALPFGEFDMQRLRKAATCLIRIPDGGFGSGFLYGDRRTIATAAHCVASRDVGTLEFVFAPTERDEETFSGAKLVYFDAKQDVAVLTLDEPVGYHRPYFLTQEPPAVGNPIVILGNPGRGARPDPTYSRTASIAETRPDEFSLDIEVKPGYSGGPVVRADTFEVLGITSFKIVGGTDYENIGKSFAKGADIAGDAYRHWSALDSDSRLRRVERETDRYVRDFGLRSANEAAKNMYVDSAIYTTICIEVIREYIEYVNRALSRLPNPTSRRMYERARKDAHEEFLKERAPILAERTRERVTPKIRTITMSHYDAALADDGLDLLVKKDLEKLHETYAEIKAAAENITDPSGSTKRGMSAEQFLRHIIDQFDDVRYYYGEVASATASVNL